MFTIPTLLTLGRLVLLPFLVWAILTGHIWIGFGIYVIGAITDYLDGWIARRFDMVSAFGTFLDPIADKIYVGAVFIALAATGTMHWLVLAAMVVIISREFLISGLREYLGPKNIQMPVSKLAKWKTAIQMIAGGALILAPIGVIVNMAGILGLMVAAALTVLTGWQYMLVGMQHLDKD